MFRSLQAQMLRYSLDTLRCILSNDRCTTLTDGPERTKKVSRAIVGHVATLRGERDTTYMVLRRPNLANIVERVGTVFADGKFHLLLLMILESSLRSATRGIRTLGFLLDRQVP